MNCPICGKLHKKYDVAYKCLCKIEYEWGHYVIMSRYNENVIFENIPEPKNEKHFNETKEKLDLMLKYMKKFE